MGITELMTIIFICMKLTNHIDWPWVFVLLPETIALIAYCSFVLWFAFDTRHTRKECKARRDKQQAKGRKV